MGGRVLGTSTIGRTGAQLAEIAADRHVTVRYRNHRGATAVRVITPLYLHWGSTEHHPVDQWILTCWDWGKGAERSYALRDCDFKVNLGTQLAHDSLALAQQLAALEIGAELQHEWGTVKRENEAAGPCYRLKADEPRPGTVTWLWRKADPFALAQELMMGYVDRTTHVTR